MREIGEENIYMCIMNAERADLSAEQILFLVALRYASCIWNEMIKNKVVLSGL